MHASHLNWKHNRTQGALLVRGKPVASVWSTPENYQSLKLLGLVMVLSVLPTTISHLFLSITIKRVCIVFYLIRMLL